MSGFVKGVGATLAGVTLVGGLSAFGIFYMNGKRDCTYTTYKSKLKPEYFKDRIIWITGASSGIGKELTFYLDSLNVGVKFVLTARRESKLQEIKKQLTNTKSNDVYILPMDLSIYYDWIFKTKYESILKYFNVSSIDILINNAGFSMRSYFVDMALKDSLEMLQTNLISSIILTKMVLDDMIKHNKNGKEMFGHIINISSVAAKFQPPTRSTYTATKSGLSGLGQSLFSELSEYENISITDVMPGAVKTDVDIAAKGRGGSGHNKRDNGIQSGMDARRCAEIICIAASNKIFQCWPVKNINAMYVAHYLPSLWDKRVRHTVAAKLKNDAGYNTKSKL